MSRVAHAWLVCECLDLSDTFFTRETSKMAAGTLPQDLDRTNSDIVDLSILSQDSVILSSCKEGMELGSMHCLVYLN